MAGFPEPLITVEQLNIIVDKSLNDLKKWKTSEIKAKAGIIKIIVWGIIGTIVAITLFKLLVPSQPQPVKEIVTQAPTVLTAGLFMIRNRVKK